jgi:Type IV secretory system Conjugative DNA transfer
MRGDWETIECLRKEGEVDLPSAHAMLWTNLRNNPAFDGLVAGIGDTFANMYSSSDKGYDGVLQVANRNTEFIDSPAMQRCLQTSDFQLSDLKTDPAGLSIFLCLPQRYMSTHYRWLRMMISLTVTEMEKVRGRPAAGYPILMLLDEFAGLKRMEIIESAVAQIAGFGVKMFFVLQGLEQLKSVYRDNWETFLANSGLKIFFNLEDNFSRDYVARLIGETEVLRELHTASDSKSESESFSQSTTRSRSETKGTSSSIGTSVTDGTNSSVSKGQSWGISKSKGKSWNWSTSEKWTPGLIFRSYEPGVTEGKSESLSTNKTKSEGWNTGQSKGVSHSTSKSHTDGTSESVTTGTSETEGVTRGTSQSRTTGTNESIQKRALITPDEIGQVFARIDDRNHQAYPGLALVLVSGARPVALRRVNYFEDYQFIGLFDPHPDFPYTAPKELTVEGRSIAPALLEFGLSIDGWSIKSAGVARGGDEAALVVVTSNRAPVAHLRVPRNGMIRTVDGVTGEKIPDGRLFSLLHYEDGAEVFDPFAELRAFFDKVRAKIASKNEAAERKRKEDAQRAKNRKRARTAALAGAVVIGIAIVTVGVKLESAARARAAEKDRAAKIAEIAQAVKTIEADYDKYPAHQQEDTRKVIALFRQACGLGDHESCENADLLTKLQEEEDRQRQNTASHSASPAPLGLAPAPPPIRSSTATDDPIGQGGIISPPQLANKPQATVDDPVGSGGLITPPVRTFNVEFCVPAFLVERRSWDHTKPGTVDYAFKTFVRDYMRANGTEQTKFRIRNEAFEIFAEKWQAVGRYDNQPQLLVDTVRAGQPCGVGDYTYQTAVQIPR